MPDGEMRTWDPADEAIEDKLARYAANGICSLCKTFDRLGRAECGDKWVCSSCAEKIDEHMAKVEARAERLFGRAEKLRAEGEAGWKQAHTMADAIPFGQPILVGHHSEGRDRNYRARIDALHRRSYEAMERANELQRRAAAAENNRAVSSDNPAAVLLLQQKLQKLEDYQADMVRLNQAVRKVVKPFPAYQGIRGTMAEMNAHHSDYQAAQKAYYAAALERAPELAKLAHIDVEAARKLLTPDFAGRIGVPDYRLTNNSARIRDAKERIAQLQHKRETAGQVVREEMHGQIRLERDVEANRLRLHFPDKPVEAIRHELHHRGFVFSRREMAWQRQLNNAAEYAAECVLRLVEAQAKGAADVEEYPR